MKTVTKSGLPIGLGIKVSATLRGEKYKVAIRGWMENQYIIVDNPNFHGEVVKIAPQTGCTMTYTLDGTFINFKTAVLHSFSQAVSLMILEFPKQFDLHNLRKNQRQKTNYSINFAMDSNAVEFPHPGTARDLSLTGLLLCHSQYLEKGNRIGIRINLQQGDLNGVVGVVRNVRKNPNNEREPYVTGIEFDTLSEEHKVVLRAFIESRVVDRRESRRPTGVL